MLPQMLTGVYLDQLTKLNRAVLQTTDNRRAAAAPAHKLDKVVLQRLWRHCSSDLRNVYTFFSHEDITTFGSIIIVK